MPLKLTIITPEKIIVDKDVDEVVAPGWLGEFGVLPGHARFITLLNIGELIYKTGGEEEHLAVNWGFAEINQTRMTVLVETAEFDHDIDFKRALAAKQRAEEEIKKTSMIDAQYEALEAALKRALLRLDLYQKYGKQK
ncbi:MAG: F0F1 ATP synthase subunit epsilon [Deltaproteobacteria bacterium]|nr:F0F1 ATP synthase subunit epsilon [Deltaproteobacteria bacterium]